jgi:putative aminopeptidase FrvX
MNKDSLQFFKELIATPSPSGFEMGIQRIVRKKMETFCDQVRADVHGNTIGVLHPEAPFRVMLSGHCDEIGFMVMHVDDKGFIYVAAVGGIDTAVVSGQRVIIHAAKGPVPGVFGRKPIHLLEAEERNKPAKLHELWIDIGAKSRKEALKVIEIGDYATIVSEIQELRNDLVSGRGFDDRAGAFVVVETLRRLKEKECRVGVYGVSSVQEEVGLRGAKTSAYGIDPHVGIAIDVGFATDCPSVDPKIVGQSALGKGPTLHRGPNINPVLGRLMEDVARKRKIPFQITPEPRVTGTDANVIQVTRSGVATALLSVPNRYMHTPVEVISLEDLDNASRLLAEVICALKPTSTFIPGE